MTSVVATQRRGTLMCGSFPLRYWMYERLQFGLKAEFDVLTSINQGEIQLNFHKLGKKVVRSGYTWTRSMSLKRNEKTKSMQISCTVVTKDSTGDNMDLNLN